MISYPIILWARAVARVIDKDFEFTGGQSIAIIWGSAALITSGLVLVLVHAMRGPAREPTQGV